MCVQKTVLKIKIVLTSGGNGRFVSARYNKDTICLWGECQTDLQSVIKEVAQNPSSVAQPPARVTCLSLHCPMTIGAQKNSTNADILATLIAVEQ